ncbi:MAG: hypothetical protein J7500_16835 [Sphingomonas sp.]|uniref:hypothetical protein n=1 Tax=Sphingomonas sp. TaxID=28214 RepID=UPI001B1B9907|nr:hypothetical protein [Sphingomonas sp.]MBO9624376.1 hypothetical protein [Sphingomonas sp.]
MRVLQLFQCVRGKHHRSRRLAWSDGTTYRSWCVGCGKPLIRSHGGWQADPDPPPPPDGHSKAAH